MKKPDTIAFEVDPARLFDTVREMRGDCQALGERLFAVLIGREGSRELIGLASYGVVPVAIPDPNASVQIPVHADQAALMVLMGMDYLERFAPERLKAAERNAFEAGWKTNAVLAEDAEHQGYLDGCLEADWNHYKTKGHETYVTEVMTPLEEDEND